MRKNNFDCSSSGLDITVSAFYDSDLARFWFDEAFFTYDKKARDSQLVYCEGNFSEWEKEYTFTKPEILTAWVNVENKKDFLDNFRSRMGFGYSKATKEDLVAYCKAELYYEKDWLEFCEKSGFKANFDILASRGYCQGDYKEVIVPHKFWECIGRPLPENIQADLGQYIDQLLWDAPIYCCFKVGKNEFRIDDNMSDSYKWDKSVALSIAAILIEKDYALDQQKIILDFLNESLPVDLD